MNVLQRSPSLKSEDGVVIIITAICIVGILAIAGLVIDSGMMEYRKLTLFKGSSAASLRASQLYYNGMADQNKINAAAREVARLNLLYSGLDSTAAADAAAGMKLETDPGTGRIDAAVEASQRYFFAQIMPNVGFARPVNASAAASYFRKADGSEHFGHVFIAQSRFLSMAAPMPDSGGEDVDPKTVTPDTTMLAPPGSKGDAGLNGLKELFDSLDGEEVTLVGAGIESPMLTTSLPINDEPCVHDTSMTNREYAKKQAEALQGLDAGAALSDALKAIISEIKKLNPVERENSVVIILSDGFTYIPPTLDDLFNLNPPGSCRLISGQTMVLTNQIRALGVTVNSIGLYAEEPEFTGFSPTDVDLAWVISLFGHLGKIYMKAFASYTNDGVDCTVLPHTQVFSNQLRPGKYAEPKSAGEVAAALGDMATKTSGVSASVPRRIGVGD